MTFSRRTLSLLLLGAVIGCVGRRPPAPVTPEQAASYEPIWTAVLGSLRGGAAPGELDRGLARILDSTAPHTPPALVIALRQHRDSGLAGYRPEWLADVVRDRLVDEVCPFRAEETCGGATLTSLIRLGDPVFDGEGRARVGVVDVTEVPADCRRGGPGGFVGIHFATAHLSRQGAQWRVDSLRTGMTGSGFCGEPSPRTRRLERENRRVERRESPIAGTWRYVVTLPEGDSLVVFARTSRHPQSMLRARSQAENHDFEGQQDHPIVGYYLDANCSFDLSKVDTDARGSVGCYHAVSLDPVSRSRDSTVWRGESEAESSAWILLDSIPLKPQLRAAFGDDQDRDPEWYFMPGYWIRDHGGRFRFSRDIVHEGRLLLRIRGERISHEVLPPE